MKTLVFIFIFSVVVDYSSCFNISEHGNRRLSAYKPKRENKGSSGRGARKKATKLNIILEEIKKLSIPADFKPMSWSQPHRPQSRYVVFAAAMNKDMMPSEVNYFAGTARKVGIDGDIVLALQPDTPLRVFPHLKKYNLILYNITTKCSNNIL